MRRRLGEGGSGVRDELAAHLREMAALYYEPEAVERDPGGWLRTAAALDAGEVLTFAGWQLPQGARPVGRPNDLFRLEADGRVVEVEDW